jgi:hypothetical protein
MEAIAVIVVLGCVGYLVSRKSKSLDIKPQINKSHVRRYDSTDNAIEHEKYLQRVVEENEEKERAGKLKVENAERIKKEFL